MTQMFYDFDFDGLELQFTEWLKANPGITNVRKHPPEIETFDAKPPRTMPAKPMFMQVDYQPL